MLYIFCMEYRKHGDIVYTIIMEALIIKNRRWTAFFIRPVHTHLDCILIMLTKIKEYKNWPYISTNVYFFLMKYLFLDEVPCKLFVPSLASF